MNKQLSRALVDLRYLEEGLALNKPATEEHKTPISDQLKTLSPAESRAARRKFRKLWRKCRGNLESDDNDDWFGDPGTTPNSEQRRHRRNIVNFFISADVVKK